MMKEKIICFKCSRSHTVDEYHESRFCRNCGKFLSLNSPLNLITGLKNEDISMHLILRLQLKRYYMMLKRKGGLMCMLTQENSIGNSVAILDIVTTCPSRASK